MNGRGYLLPAGILAAGLLAACGSVDLGGLGEGAAAAADGGAVEGDGGSSPAALPRDGSAPPAAQGLILQRAGFVEGFEGSDWQCNGALCLRGRITP